VRIEAIAGRALHLVVVLLCLATDAHAEVPVGRGTSATRNQPDWKSYFNGDLRTLTMHSETRTVFPAGDNPRVDVGGVEFDIASWSPMQTKTVSRVTTRATDPDFGAILVESESKDALGRESKDSFTLRDKSLMVPIVVGPMVGTDITSSREMTVDGKTFVLRSVSRTVSVDAILVAPTFEDLLAKRGVREVTELGTRTEAGTMRVLAPSGAPIGFFAGDVRRIAVELYAAPK